MKEIIDKTFKGVFGVNNPFTNEEILEKFGFDMELPVKVNDSTTNEESWTVAVNQKKFMTPTNIEKIDSTKGWMRDKEEITSLEDILRIWNEVNYTTTERNYDVVNVVESDTIYNGENIYRSCNSGRGKNYVYCDGMWDSEYAVCCKRSATCEYCIRVDDSSKCNNSYNVICSGGITNSLFINDCSDLYECMFCSHISSKKYCIANMQFEKDVYFAIKEQIIKWIISK